MSRAPRVVRDCLFGLLACFLLASLPGCGGCGSPKINRLKQGYTRDDDEDQPVATPVAVQGTKTTTSATADAASQTSATVKAPESTQGPTAPTAAAPVEMPLGGAEDVDLPVARLTRALPSIARRQHTLQRMRKISLAIGDYVQKHKQFPAPAVYNRDKYPLLSWRVHLLPYLGQEVLYEKFRLNEPWNSAYNSSLISQIPTVYQSPDRGDEKTNYLLVTGPGTIFAGTEGAKPQDVLDGLASTAMLVEVNDDQAVPWTQPIDWTYAPEGDPRRGLDALREDGFFVAFAKGTLGRIPPDVEAYALRPMFTRAGREPFQVEKASQGATEATDPKFADRLKTKAVATVGATPKPETEEPGDGSISPLGPARPATTPGASGKPRLAVPDDEAQKTSMALFREIYREQYESAKAPRQKYELAKKLLEQAGKLTADPAGRYVLLTVAAKVSAEIGDVSTTMNVAEQLVATYELNAFETKTEMLLKTSKVPPYSKACNDKVIDVCEEFLTQALADDNFSLALELHGLALAAARRGKDKVKSDEIAARRKEIDLARLGYAKVEKVVDSLRDDPENPDANLIVGRYFCFIKRNYERGLPMLALGSDDGLKRLARQELKLPVDAEEQTALADAWWEIAEHEKDKEARREITLRAVHWYLIAAPRLPAGLLQVKAQVRVRDAEKTHGKEAVESIRLAQKGKV